MTLAASTSESLPDRLSADDRDLAAAPPGPATSARPQALPRVLIITENASIRFGGEAVLPLHYFRRLLARGVPVWLITNHRNKAELTTLLSPAELSRVRFAPDTRLHRLLAKTVRVLPPRVHTFLVGSVLGIAGQMTSRRIAREMIREHAVEIVHQPTPVSPKQVSVLHTLRVPLVIGPMNGGMTFPPAFRRRERIADRLFNRVGRACAASLNRLFPGKLRAATLLVSNDRTRQALPRATRGRVETLVENGVDLTLWQPRDDAQPAPASPAHATAAAPASARFISVGRLIPLKGIDLLLHALAAAGNTADIRLEIIGDGPERPALEALARRLGVEARVSFAGWLSQLDCAARLATADGFVLPSLHECGGAAVLEAMACGLPCIATNWGGPADYLDPSCGILVNPTGREAFIAGLAGALVKLARSPELRRQLGAAGRAKAIAQFDWERKIDQMLAIYRETLDRHAGASRSISPPFPAATA